MEPTPQELMEAYRRSGLSLRGYSYRRAVETPMIYTSLRCLVRAMRGKEQHGKPAPIQRAIF